MSSTADSTEQAEATGVQVEAPAKPKGKSTGTAKPKGKATAKPKGKATGTAKPKGKASTPRSKFPVLKSEAACLKVMKEHEAGYKQYQVERDKNRNEKGMERHRLAYRTYKNAYTQLLALRKKAGKGRRNAKASA